MTTPSSPSWMRIYRYLTEEPPKLGTVIAHETLFQIAGLSMDNERHWSQYYRAVGLACIELENEKSRTLLTERGTGYRYVAGNLHIEKAISGALSVRRRLARIAGTASTVDVDGLSEPEAERVRNAQQVILSQLETMNRVYFRPPQFGK